jgi:putative membrane protein
VSAVDRPGPDPSRRTGPVSEHLANERTFLAWIRTSIAILTLGFVVAKFSVWLRQFLATVATSSSVPARSVPPSGASLPMGLVLMARGAVTAALALWRHVEADRAIARGEYHPTHGLSTLVTLTVLAVAVVLIVYLYRTSAGI